MIIECDIVKLLTGFVLAAEKLGPQEGDQRFQAIKTLAIPLVQNLLHRKTPVSCLARGGFSLLPTTYQVSAARSFLSVDWPHPSY
jgi:hypothetical protein